MKTFTFRLFGRVFTITFGGKKEARKLADILKQKIEEYPYLDVGEGAEYQFGASRKLLNMAIDILLKEGYRKHLIVVHKESNPKEVKVAVLLTKAEVAYSEAWESVAKEINMSEDLLSVRDCCEAYITSQMGKLACSTLDGYRNIVNNHLHGLMIYYVDDIDDTIIQEEFDKEIAKGLSEKTLKGYRSFIMKVLAEYRPDLKPEIRVIPWEAEPQWTVRKEEANQ